MVAGNWVARKEAPAARMDDADITLGKLSREAGEGDGVGFAISRFSADAVGIFFAQSFLFGLGGASKVVFSFGVDAFVDGLGVVARLADPGAGLHGGGDFSAIAKKAAGSLVVLNGIDSHFMLWAGRWWFWRPTGNGGGFWEHGLGFGQDGLLG